MRIARLWRQEAGATAVEYGLIVAFIAAVIVATVGLIEGRIAGAFTTVATALERSL